MLSVGNMIVSNFAKKVAMMPKQSTVLLRHAHKIGRPGENFPLDFDGGKYKITGIFTAFFGIGLGAPFLVVWHQMHRE